MSTTVSIPVLVNEPSRDSSCNLPKPIPFLAPLRAGRFSHPVPFAHRPKSTTLSLATTLFFYVFPPASGSGGFDATEPLATLSFSAPAPVRLELSPSSPILPSLASAN